MPQTLFAVATLLLSAALAASAPQAGPDAVWLAPRHTLDQLSAQCKGQAVPDVRQCLLSFMESSGAKPQAVAFAQGLEGVGFLRSLEPHDPVAVAFVTYPFRANANEGVLLVNGEPPLVDVSDPARLKPLLQDPRLRGVRVRQPDAGIWASDPGRPRVKKLRAKGVRFEFAFPVRVCHACADLAHARVGYDFDGSGRFLGAKLIGVNEAIAGAPGKED